MTQNSNDVDEPETESRWGTIVLLAFLIGVPAIGMIVKMLGLY